MSAQNHRAVGALPVLGSFMHFTVGPSVAVPGQKSACPLAWLLTHTAGAQLTNSTAHECSRQNSVDVLMRSRFNLLRINTRKMFTCANV